MPFAIKQNKIIKVKGVWNTTRWVRKYNQTQRHIELKLKRYASRRMKLNKIYSNEGFYIKPIVALNSV